MIEKLEKNINIVQLLNPKCIKRGLKETHPKCILKKYYGKVIRKT
jgi:hypothetical protein